MEEGLRAMKDNLQSIKRRLKKYMWFFILLPVLAGVLGYFLGKSYQHKNHVYTVGEEIALGQYEESNKQYTDPAHVVHIFHSTLFLKKAKVEKHLKMPISDIKSKLNITVNSLNILTLKLTGARAEVVKTDLSKIVKVFLKESKQKYKKKLDIVNGTINSLKKEKPFSVNAASGGQKLLYDLQVERINMQPPSVVQRPVVLKDLNKAKVSTGSRTVLGVIIGVILSLFILLVPEILRNRE